ncbi:MAG TPA: PEP-CTERM sorting domain-containing protein [Lacipirellulaceae bacterium]|jgi:hypothetical protein|nr:PEP-CTERM sorting domain-containing protein [Lacipirellulaceae bacterium]
MKRLFPLQILVALGALCLSTSTSRAQPGPSDIVDHFRLVPRFSTLRQMGGIAGIELDYRLRGEYDFRQRLDEHREARFEHAEIWGSLISDLPTPAYVLDVDEILNLEGLKGEALRVDAPFNVYKFTGETSDKSSVELFAAVLGDWMFVRGDTEPPPGSADFFTYHVKWLARSRPFADLNGNGFVDAADYVLIRKAETSGVAVGSEENGTAGVTFADWVRQFGETVPDVRAIEDAIRSATASATVGSVPEPASVSFALLGGVLLTNLRRRRATAMVCAAAEAW